MPTPVKVGIVGCGNISGKYLRTAQFFPILKVVAVADIDPARAQAKAQEAGGIKACGVDQLLADPDVELVVNLTTPDAHASIAQKAVENGKHVFNEKPLTVTIGEAEALLKAAHGRKVRVGCAPGTFLGAGLQSARKYIDDGLIGTPLTATAFMLCPGHERWHPGPEYYYKTGAGPMFDMGPYYLTALQHLLGGITRVSGMAGILWPERTIAKGPKEGAKFKVETPDHVTGTVQFESGGIGTIVTSFCSWGHHLPRIEVYGTTGTLLVPDPNALGGPVLHLKGGEKEWRELPLTHGHEVGGDKWGIGVADLAYAIRSGRPHRATGENALQVLETMHAFLQSAETGKHVAIKSKFVRPSPLPTGLPADALDE